VVRRVRNQGKGNVVRRMFSELDADIYVMVDGDATYPACRAAELVAPVAAGEADMVVGSRARAYSSTHFRKFHRFGNELIRKLVRNGTFVGCDDLEDLAQSIARQRGLTAAEKTSLAALIDNLQAVIGCRVTTENSGPPSTRAGLDESRPDRSDDGR